MASRENVRVRVYKEYTYPKSMLDKDYIMQDAEAKAKRDIDTEIREREIGEFKGVDHTWFKYEVEELLSFKAKKLNTKSALYKITLESAINTIVKTLLEERYGKLNPDTNKDLFNIHTHKKNAYRDAYEEVTLKEHIQKEWDELAEKYFKILVTLVQ